jgi:uncharacterized protein (DUF697 family)
MPKSSATEWVVVPQTPQQIADVTRYCRKLVNRRAMMAAGVAMVPVPGLDWMADVSVLLKVIPDISRAFGLTPEQIEHLAPDKKLAVYKAISAGGSLLVGKLLTRDLVIRALKMVGVRLTTQQAAKYVPLAGQAVSALLTFSALKYICEQHIKQCAEVSRMLALPAPGQTNHPTPMAEVV